MTAAMLVLEPIFEADLPPEQYAYRPIKHKVRRRKGGTYPLSHLYGHFGLVRLTALGRDRPWANVSSCPRAGCGRSACPVRRAGCGKRSHGYTTKAPPDERGGNRYVQPKATASHSDSL
jgi:hypothetical protein